MISEPSRQQMEVVFPRTCTSENLEHVLRKHYSRSLHAQEITFILEEIRWIDIGSLSIIVLWIGELTEQGKKITITYPSSVAASRLLDSYAVTSFLKASGADIARKSLRELKAVTSDLLRAPLYPLTFFSAEAFQSLISDLRNPNRLELVFGDLTGSEVISSGAIRDVILFELVDNIFEHANGRMGHMIMTKATAPSIYRSGVTHGDLGPLNSVETKFLSKLDGGEYINIVIGDKGPGIDATLREAYLKHHESLETSPERASECEVLDFSFHYAATRRSREQRLAKIKQALKGDLDIAPATGLFGVREIVRRLSGYIQIRSGRSIVCYDFLSQKRNPDAPAFISCQTEGMRRLAHFGGAQFKIYLPVHLTSRWKTRVDHQTKRTPYRSREAPGQQVSSYFSLTSARGMSDTDEESSILLVCQEYISQIRQRRNNESWILVFDLEGYQGLSAKALHYLSYTLLSDQQRNELTLIVNAPKSLILSISNEIQRPVIALGKILAIVDEDRDVHFLSHQGLTSSPLPKSANIETFVFRWKDAVGEELEPEDLSDKIRTLASLLLREGVKKALSEIIYSPGNHVYDSSLRVRLPSDAYCEGFFNLTMVYRFEPFRLFLAEWVSLWAQELEATAIVVIGSHLFNILEVLQHRVRLILIPTRRDSLVDVRSGLGQLSEDDRVILMTDVLGTGKTTKAAMAAMQNVRQLEVLAVVDASSPEEGSSREVTLADAVVKGSVQYFPDLPRGWDVSSIWEIDPRTRHLIRVRGEDIEPLWKQVNFLQQDGFKRSYRNNDLFSSLSVSAGILSVGHFVSNERHITYLFNIAAVAQHFCDEIAAIIYEDAGAAIMSLAPEASVQRVFYPSYNPGMQLIARSLARLFPGSEVSPVEREELIAQGENPVSRERSGAAIIVDDAFESGETVFRLMDRTERLFFGLIMVYPLIRRGSEESGRRFQKISSYGGARFYLQFLSEASIPTFSAHTCPVCENTTEWLQAEEKLRDCAAITYLVKKRLEEMLPKSVAAISQEQLILPLGEAETEHRIMGEFRWRLEIARTLHSEKEYFVELLTTSGRLLEKNIFLRVLSHDRFIENLTAQERGNFFDEKLTAAVVAHAETVLSNPRTNPLKILDDALVAILNLDIDSFNTRFRKVLTGAFNAGPGPLGWAVAFTIRKQRQISAVSLVLQELIQLDKRCDENDPRREIIDEAVKLWRFRQDEVNTLRENRVSVYRELIGGRLHEVSHLKEDLMDRTRENPIDIAAIERSWGAMELEMRERIFPLLRKFWRGEMNEIFRNTFYTTFDALRYQLEEGGSVVSELRKISNFDDNDHPGEIREAMTHRLGAIATRAENLVFGEKGLRKSLYMFRQDLHILVNSIVQHRQGELQSREIKARVILPDEDCLVFFDDVALRQVLHILIDNVLHHSMATKFLIDATIEKDKGRVVLAVIDNGKGFRAHFAMGEGLRRAKSILSAYSASLKIKSYYGLPRQYSAAGFRAGIFMNLVHLPSRRKLE